MSIAMSENSVSACSVADLIVNSGVAVKIGTRQLALFYLPEASPSLYVLDNYDPIGAANVISRGIVGDIKGELVVASPLFKQRYNLASGVCLDDESVALRCYRAKIVDDQVVIWL